MGYPWELAEYLENDIWLELCLGLDQLGEMVTNLGLRFTAGLDDLKVQQCGVQAFSNSVSEIDTLVVADR